MLVKVILCLVIGYVIGTFSTGYIVGKFQKIDIRDYGSGNAGTTNAFRVMGKAAGVITFIGDFLKAFVPLMLIKYVIWPGEEYTKLLMLIAGLAIVLGHNYPVWLHFKGGKGIAATGGVFVAFDPLIILPGILFFGGVILLSKYVSLGSLVVSILFPVWVALSTKGEPYYWVMVGVTCIYTLSAFYMHRSNIVRLVNGTENRIGGKAILDKSAATDASDKEQSNK